jgi:hypothetical protein
MEIQLDRVAAQRLTTELGPHGSFAAQITSEDPAMLKECVRLHRELKKIPDGGALAMEAKFSYAAVEKALPNAARVAAVEELIDMGTSEPTNVDA